MVTKSSLVPGAVLFLAAAAAPASWSEVRGRQSAKETEAQELAARCSARKFETSVELPSTGGTRKSKITLCGEPDQTDAEWELTLRDAIEKIRSNEKLPAAARDRIVAEMNEEIAKLRHAAAPAPAPAPAPTPALRQEAATHASPPVATPTPVSSPAPARPPRLTIRCDTPGERGGDACTLVQRDTAFAITADDDMSAGTALRFMRRGSLRAELALAAMRRGETVRIKLPHRVCDGILNSRVEIQVVRRGAAGAGSGGVTESLGPYPLSC